MTEIIVGLTPGCLRVDFRTGESRLLLGVRVLKARDLVDYKLFAQDRVVRDVGVGHVLHWTRLVTLPEEWK